MIENVLEKAAKAVSAARWMILSAEVDRAVVEELTERAAAAMLASAEKLKALAEKRPA